MTIDRITIYFLQKIYNSDLAMRLKQSEKNICCHAPGPIPRYITGCRCFQTRFVNIHYIPIDVIVYFSNIQ